MGPLYALIQGSGSSGRQDKGKFDHSYPKPLDAAPAQGVGKHGLRHETQMDLALGAEGKGRRERSGWSP